MLTIIVAHLSTIRFYCDFQSAIITNRNLLRMIIGYKLDLSFKDIRDKIIRFGVSYKSRNKYFKVVSTIDVFLVDLSKVLPETCRSSIAHLVHESMSGARVADVLEEAPSLLKSFLEHHLWYVKVVILGF